MNRITIGQFGLLISALLGLSSEFVKAHDGFRSSYYRPAGAESLPVVAGGYRALFTCSAHFHAGRDLADILAVELVDTQDLNLPPPHIDRRRQLVRAQGPDGATAIAVYRAGSGCTLLPPDMPEAMAARLPTVQLAAPPDLSDVDFPHGDRVLVPEPSAEQAALLTQAFDGETFGAGTVTASVLVLHKGRLVAERYAPGFDQHAGYRTWSTAKSITATLIGMAIRDGLLALDRPAPIPEWRYGNDPRAAITIEHLLHMSSGLVSEGANTAAIYFAGQAVIPAITGTPLEAAPNSRWKYANNDTLLLLRALRHVLDDELRYLRYPYDELFHKVGMYHTRMEMDHAGNFIGSSQVYTTARDLARFGLLYLNGGEWRGERLLPEGWTDYVAEAAPARPRKAGEQGYGAQFWLLDTLPEIPPGTYTTAGNKGQFVTIVPALDAVVVRTGVDPNGHRWQHDAFLAAALPLFAPQASPAAPVDAKPEAQAADAEG